MEKKEFELPIIEVVDFGTINCDPITSSGPGQADFGANGDEWQVNPFGK